MIFSRAVLLITLIVLAWTLTAEASRPLPKEFCELFDEWVRKYGLGERFDEVHGRVAYTERALAILQAAALASPVFARFADVTFKKVSTSQSFVAHARTNLRCSVAIY